jgi:hypothetical protein
MIDPSISSVAEVKPFKVVKTLYGTEYWTNIKAYQARNYDGSLAGWEPGTPEGEREVVEKKFVSEDGLTVRYSNYW